MVSSASKELYEKFSAEREAAEKSGYKVSKSLLELVRGPNLRTLVRHIATQDKNFAKKSAELATIALIRLYGSHDVPKATKREAKIDRMLNSIRRGRVARQIEGQSRNFREINGARLYLN